jgi:heme-degrading monooxygenase HmoA
MFIAVTRIRLPRERRERMLQAFRQNAPDLKRFDGFLGFELWQNDDTLEAVSRWESRQAMEAYSHSAAFQAHHGGPAGGGGTAAGHGPGAGGQGAAQPAGGEPAGGEVAYYDGEVVI